MLAKTNSFRIKYRFVHQTLDVCKPKTVGSIEDNNDIKLLSAHIRKMQNIADVITLASTKAVVGRRKLDVSDKNEVQKEGISCKIS